MLGLLKKSHIQETLNLSTNADRSTITMNLFLSLLSLHANISDTPFDQGSPGPTGVLIRHRHTSHTYINTSGYGNTMTK